MFDTFIDAVPLNNQFVVQLADTGDLAAVLAIYNQSIAGKQATANLAEVSYEERADWFSEHINNPQRPIYVVKTNSQNTADSQSTDSQSTDSRSTGDHSTNEQNSETAIIVAWGSFSDLYARTAYHISSEISIYLHSDYHGQGLGGLLTRWMLTQAPTLGIRNIVALIFAHNQPSLGLFGKLGFTQWGYMPQVCDMQGFIADVVMLGIAVDASHCFEYIE